MNKGRNSAIELLRIVFAIAIIILHYNLETIGGAFQYTEPGSINEKWLLLSESVGILAVNVFLLISGYYSCLRMYNKTIKIFSLLIQTSIFIGGFYVIDQLIAGNRIMLNELLFNFLPNNYFVILFCTLTILAPFINYLLIRLKRRSLVRLVLLMLFCFLLRQSFLIGFRTTMGYILML